MNVIGQRYSGLLLCEFRLFFPLGDWYASLPPITKTWGTACVATTVLVQFGMISPFKIAIFWRSVIYHFEIWRLLTPFLFIGGFGLPFVMNLMILVTYCVPVEKVE